LYQKNREKGYTLLFTIYATATIPTIANTISKPGSSGASAAGTDVGVSDGLGDGLGVRVTGAGVSMTTEFIAVSKMPA